MPGRPASLGRNSWMTSSAAGRSARGLRRMKMRPTFICWLEPPAPMKAMVAATLSSARMMRTASCCMRYMASKDTSCEASVKPNSDPTSSLGRKPFGMTANR